MEGATADAGLCRAAGAERRHAEVTSHRHKPSTPASESAFGVLHCAQIGLFGARPSHTHVARNRQPVALGKLPANRLMGQSQAKRQDSRRFPPRTQRVMWESQAAKLSSCEQAASLRRKTPGDSGHRKGDRGRLREERVWWLARCAFRLASLCCLLPPLRLYTDICL